MGQPASAQGCANADAQLSFAFSITPSGGALLPAAAVAAPVVVAQVSVSFASLLGVPAASVSVTSVTDIAAGTSIYFLPPPPKASATRLRQLAGAPGSAGCSVNVSIDLGASPPAALAASMTKTLVQLAASPASSFFMPILGKAAAAASVSAGTLTPALAAASVSTVAAFAVPQPVAASSGGGGGGGGAGPAAGGAVGGIVVLVLAFWSWRSYAKHGSLPCCRNRKKEESERKQKAMLAAKSELERQQAEAGAGAVPGTLSVRKLVSEVDELKAQLARERAEKKSIKAAKGEQAGGADADADADASSAFTAQVNPLAKAAFTPSAAAK